MVHLRRGNAVKYDHPVDSLLSSWGAWCRRENNAGLGYSQVAYNEFIARSTSATGFVDFDPAILRLDGLIRQHLAYTPRRMLELRYVNNLPDKTAGRLLSMSRQEFCRVLNIAVLPQLRHAWDTAVSGE